MSLDLGDGAAAPVAPGGDRRYRMHVRPNARILEGLLPVGAYIAVNLFAATEVAIAASFAASVMVFVRNRAHGTIRLLGGIGFAVVAASAVLGLISHSGKVYVAQNLVSDFIFAGVFFGSVLAGKPLIGAIAREVAPALQPVMAVNHALFTQLTLVSAAINFGEGVARIFLLNALSDNEYVIVSRVLFIPLSVGFYVLCYALVNREAIRIWPEHMPVPNRDGTPGRAEADSP
jgi:intracellular septation protein A